LFPAYLSFNILEKAILILADEPNPCPANDTEILNLHSNRRQTKVTRMSDELVKKKLAMLDESRKQKEKDRATTNGALQAIHMMKLNPQGEAYFKLLEMMLQEFAWLEDYVMNLSEQQLKTELRINEVDRNVKQLKQDLDWFDKNK
jgi:hypothetical protein